LGSRNAVESERILLFVLWLGRFVPHIVLVFAFHAFIKFHKSIGFYLYGNLGTILGHLFWKCCSLLASFGSALS